MDVHSSHERKDAFVKFLEECVIKLTPDERSRDFLRFTFHPEPSFVWPLHPEARQVANACNSAGASVFSAKPIRHDTLMIRQPHGGCS